MFLIPHNEMNGTVALNSGNHLKHKNEERNPAKLFILMLESER